MYAQAVVAPGAQLQPSRVVCDESWDAVLRVQEPWQTVLSLPKSRTVWSSFLVVQVLCFLVLLHVFGRIESDW